MRSRPCSGLLGKREKLAAGACGPARPPGAETGCGRLSRRDSHVHGHSGSEGGSRFPPEPRGCFQWDTGSLSGPTVLRSGRPVGRVGGRGRLAQSAQGFPVSSCMRACAPASPLVDACYWFPECDRRLAELGTFFSF